MKFLFSFMAPHSYAVFLFVFLPLDVCGTVVEVDVSKQKITSVKEKQELLKSDVNNKARKEGFDDMETIRAKLKESAVARKIAMQKLETKSEVIKTEISRETDENRIMELEKQLSKNDNSFLAAKNFYLGSKIEECKTYRAQRSNRTLLSEMDRNTEKCTKEVTDSYSELDKSFVIKEARCVKNRASSKSGSSEENYFNEMCQNMRKAKRESMGPVLKALDQQVTLAEENTQTNSQKALDFAAYEEKKLSLFRERMELVEKDINEREALSDSAEDGFMSSKEIDAATRELKRIQMDQNMALKRMEKTAREKLNRPNISTQDRARLNSLIANSKAERDEVDNKRDMVLINEQLKKLKNGETLVDGKRPALLFAEISRKIEKERKNVEQELDDAEKESQTLPSKYTGSKLHEEKQKMFQKQLKGYEKRLGQHTEQCNMFVAMAKQVELGNIPSANLVEAKKHFSFITQDLQGASEMFVSLPETAAKLREEAGSTSDAGIHFEKALGQTDMLKALFKTTDRACHAAVERNGEVMTELINKESSATQKLKFKTARDALLEHELRLKELQSFSDTMEMKMMETRMKSQPMTTASLIQYKQGMETSLERLERHQKEMKSKVEEIKKRHDFTGSNLEYVNNIGRKATEEISSLERMRASMENLKLSSGQRQDGGNLLKRFEKKENDRSSIVDSFNRLSSNTRSQVGSNTNSAAFNFNTGSRSDLFNSGMNTGSIKMTADSEPIDLFDSITNTGSFNTDRSKTDLFSSIGKRRRR